MNKTVTINISGIIFHIEEDAYDTLSRYLTTIKSYFHSSEGRDEIMADIEARIAELLQEKISASKQVVTMADVEHVTGIMGKPEDFAGEEQQTSGTATAAATEQQGFYESRRRLFRDPDDKILGGVCSGISHYFDIDVVWVRIVLVLLTLLGFSGILVYIILWIVVPEAKTTAEKLQMRREPVDINHISKTIKEEAENLKRKGKEYGRSFGDRSARAGDRIGDFFEDFFTSLFRVFGRIFGFLLVSGAIFFMFIFIASAFGFSVAGGTETFGEILNGIFEQPFDKRRLYIGLALLIGVPLLMIMYFGIKLLFKIKYANKWIGLTAGILWVFGIAICTYSGMEIFRTFNEYAEVESTETIRQSREDTLYIGMDMSKEFNSPEFVARGRNRDKHVSVNGDDWTILNKDDKKVFIGMTRVHIIRNHDDSVAVSVVQGSRGRTRSDARNTADGIYYNYTLKDSAIMLDNYFTIGANQKWRNQDVDVYIKVPDNKVIYLDPTVKHLIYNVENTTNTLDEHMVGRRWKMTSVGLQCIDCDGLKKNKRTEEEIEEEHLQGIKDLNEKIREEVREEIREEAAKIK